MRMRVLWFLSGKKGQRNSGQSDIPASAIFSDSFSFKYYHAKVLYFGECVLNPIIFPSIGNQSLADKDGH